MATELTPDLITSTWEPGEVRLSPDGRTAVWTAAPHGKQGEHPDSALFTAPVDGSAPARRLTRGGADTAPRWSPDGTRIAFLSDRAERGTAGLYVLDPAGGEAVPVAVRKKAVVAAGWSPDSATLAFLVPDDPDDEDGRREKERDDADVRGEREPWNRLLAVDVAPDLTAGPVRTLWSGELFATELAWSPVADRVALLARPTPELDSASDAALYLLDVPAAADTGERQKVTDAGPLRTGATPWAEQLSWTADGSRLVVVGKQTGSLQSAATVWSVVAEAGATPTVLGPGPDEPVCALDVRPAPAGWSAAVVVSIAEGIETRLEQRRDGNPGTPLWEPTGEVLGFDVAGTPDSPVIAALAHVDSGLLEVWAGPPATPRRLSDHHAAWAEVVLGEVRELVTTTADGLELHSVAVLPVDAGGGPHPTVVLPHGGPYWRMARNPHVAWHDWSQLLAAAGYAVLLPNFRGGSGHGNAFATAVQGNPAREFDDVEAVIGTAVDAGITDPDRLGIGGWSNGGFLTAWAVTRSRRFRAAVMGAGVSSWPAMSMTSDVPTFTGDVAGGSPWSVDPGASVWESPITHAADVATPLLMLHGAEDVRVPPSQSTGFLRALAAQRAAGLPVELVVYPREPHGIAEARHQVDLQRRVLSWFGTHLPVG